MTTTRRQRRLIRFLKKTPTHTVTLGAHVAVGHDRGLRVGTVVGFVHIYGVEARVEWTDGIATVLRLDALRPATRKEWRSKR